MTQLHYGVINNKHQFTRKSEGLFIGHLPMIRMSLVSRARDQKTFPPSSD